MVDILDRSWPRLQRLATGTPDMKPRHTATALASATPTTSAPTVTAPGKGPKTVFAPVPKPATTAMAIATADISMPRLKPGLEIASTEIASLDAVGNGDWAVQVGAYYDADQARRAVDTARTRLPLLATIAEEAIVVINGRKKPIFRARFVGFTQETARDICRALDKRSVACFVIKQSPDAVLASAER